MFEIIEPGLETTVQDWPGRQGYWSVGIPPSGPMDAFSFRAANRLAGNPANAAGLEITALGPTVRFHDDAVIAFTGARFQASADGAAVPWYRAFPVRAGTVLKTGGILGGGFRCYLAVRGGIDVPEYLGSRSTFAHGGFGGLDGRRLQKGDVLSVFPSDGAEPRENELGVRIAPEFSRSWRVGVIPGPHYSPDYFTEGFTRAFYETDYTVSRNANRLGVRLEGPKPEFARTDGGEGGSYPSNQIDFAYAIGSINFSGDVPIIIGADGPSLGGFICGATVPAAELWKVGQMRPGDTVRFTKMTHSEALEKQRGMERLLELL